MILLSGCITIDQEGTWALLVVKVVKLMNDIQQYRNEIRRRFSFHNAKL